MTMKLRHIALSVPDVAAAQKFFEEAFGMTKAGDAQNGVYVTDGTINVALLNKHGAHLVRAQQPLLEQPACVHASMDLLKMALKLHPWLPSELVGDCLEVAIAARTLDVSASPYDLTRYDLAPVCIETETGRLEFRRRQLELMARAQPVRARLLLAYDAFLDAGFPAEVVEAALATPNAVHVATATPGGPAWRWSDLDARAHTSHITNELGSE
jgi:hypothetical protein